MSDERDPKVSQRYRELGAEEPSRELDQTILAAAHRAAARPHAPLVTPAGRHRWYFALGAAAVLVLAVAVTVQMERRQPDFEALPPAPVTTEQTQAAKEAAQAAKKEERRAAPARRAPPAETRDEERAMDSGARPEVPPAASPAAKPPAERLDTNPRARVQAGEAQIESPERWLERIVRLRKEGRHEDADKQLAEFRKRYPGYKVPGAALR